MLLKNALCFFCQSVLQTSEIVHLSRIKNFTHKPIMLDPFARIMHGFMWGPFFYADSLLTQHSCSIHDVLICELVRIHECLGLNTHDCLYSTQGQWGQKLFEVAFGFLPLFDVNRLFMVVCSDVWKTSKYLNYKYLR